MGKVRDFLLPDLGEGLESGEIVQWNVEVGDRVELNQEICEVETAKAVVAVPCPFAGTVVERFGAVGEELDVGQPLIRIDVEEVASDADVAAAEPDEAAVREREADEEPVRNVLVGYGASDGPSASRRQRSPEMQQSPPLTPDEATGPLLAAPPVRKLAKDLGVDLAAIAPGSGTDGIVTREDVRAAAKSASAPSTAMPSDEHTTTGSSATGFRGQRPGDIVPIRGIRRRVVEKMTASRTEIPHSGGGIWTDCTAIWELRTTLTEHARNQGYDDTVVTPLALIVRATVLALLRYPQLNASINLDAGEIRLHREIHLGIAVDTDRGLLVPVIRSAGTLTTLELAQQIVELSSAARAGTLAPDRMAGGTFTVTNYGVFGTDDGDPVINHPEGAILGIGAIKERPWVVDGDLSVRRVAKLTVAHDHRISDGGESGRFLAYLSALVEEPARILLHA